MFKTKFKKTIGIGLVAAACLISASTASAASQNESDVKVKLDDQQRNQYTVKSFHYLTVDGKNVDSPGSSQRQIRQRCQSNHGSAQAE